MRLDHILDRPGKGLDESILEEMSKKGISQRLREGYLQSIIGSYLRGESVEQVAGSINLNPKLVRRVYSRLRKIVDQKKLLSVRDVLERTYNILKKRYSAEEYELGREVCSKIGPEERVSVMCYDEFGTMKIHSKNWAVSNRRVRSDSLGDYDSDLVVLRLNPEGDMEEWFCGEVDSSRGFENSLIVGLSRGKMIPGSGGFKKSMFGILDRNLHRFNITYREGGRTLYLPSVVPFLVESVEKVLKNSSKEKDHSS